MFTKAIDKMLSEVRESGGSTVSLIGKPVPTSGYMVGGVTNSLVLPLDILNPDDENAAQISIGQWLAYNRTLAIQDGMFMGGWIDQKEGLFYVDLSEVYYVKEYAEMIGRDRKEIAIWDNAEAKEIRL